MSGPELDAALCVAALAEAEKQAVQRVVIISDAFEKRTRRQPKDEVQAATQVWAAQLRDLGVKLVVGCEETIRGACPLDGAGPGAERAFQNIIRENGGYAFLCDPTGDLETQAAS